MNLGGIIHTHRGFRHADIVEALVRQYAEDERTSRALVQGTKPEPLLSLGAGEQKLSSVERAAWRDAQDAKHTCQAQLWSRRPAVRVSHDIRRLAVRSLALFVQLRPGRSASGGPNG